MVAQAYDIFRRDTRGEVWIEAVRDLETAKSRIIELAADKPGQYVVFNHRNGRMVSSGTVVASPAARKGSKETDSSSQHSEESETFWY
jgi:hypothetical protein